MFVGVRTLQRNAIAAAFASCGVVACGGNAFESNDGASSGGTISSNDSGGSEDAGTTSSGGALAMAGGTTGSGGYGSASAGGAIGVSGDVGAGGVTSKGGGGGSSAGGAPTSTIELATSYDRTCETDDECLLVNEGDVCGCPGCRGAAIARTAGSAWDADRARIYCPAYGAPTSCPAIACAAMLPACVAHLCVARYRHDIDATKYDATCRVSADCKLIYTGEVCSPCHCATAAINASGYSNYQTEVESVQCTPGPSACDCAPRTTVSCELPMTTGLGTCVVGP